MSASGHKRAADPYAARGVSWRSTLRIRPVHNAVAELLAEEDTGLLFRVRRQRLSWLVPPLSWVFRPRLEHRKWIDHLGAEVWRLCDGERDLESIVDVFAERNELSFHEARAAVSTYLQQLTESGILAAVAPGAESDAGLRDDQ